MQSHYPSPEEAGIRVPPHVMPERFRAGFRHALEGGQLNRVEYLRLSFREGFRAAKLYLREVRRSQGILDYPANWKIRMRAG
ncbi:MAG: hypothetical protein PVF08_00220 [Gammaproteobacteria bacterium]